jgi:hypothetical protein
MHQRAYQHDRMTNPWPTLPVLVIHFPKLDELIGESPKVTK